MKPMVKDVSEWCMRSLVCKVKEVSSILKFKENKRNTELPWKPLPALIVLPTHLEHIFTVSIALRSCACF